MNSVEKQSIRYVLWTGGFDSTFMLLRYAREKYTIQPIYVIDPKRKSVLHELNAMRSIINSLETKYVKDVKAKVLPLKIFKMEEIVDDNYLTKCYKSLSKRVKIGSQYEWLSRLALMYPFLDLGVEKHIDGFGGCTAAIMNDGGFIIENGTGRLNMDKASEETKALFGRFRFPIVTFTGEDMVSHIHSWGWDGIIEKTWFCHNPINDMPCGMCRPCQQKMEDRMEFLLPVCARKRYMMFSVTKRILGHNLAIRMVRIYRYLWRKKDCILD